MPVDSSLPDPPAWLTGAGLDAWHEIAPQLFDMRVLSEVDRTALGRYCVAYAAWREAEDTIAARGKVYPVLRPDGSLKIMRKSPHVELAFEASREMSRLESEFGLTPSARASLKVEPPTGMGAGHLYMTGAGPYMTTAERMLAEP
jgi:P27 family predicted phage terminase small subunit